MPIIEFIRFRSILLLHIAVLLFDDIKRKYLFTLFIIKSKTMMKDRRNTLFKIRYFVPKQTVLLYKIESMQNDLHLARLSFQLIYNNPEAQLPIVL